jgi:hypothetical protein
VEICLSRQTWISLAFPRGPKTRNDNKCFVMGDVVIIWRGPGQPAVRDINRTPSPGQHGPIDSSPL